MRKALSHRTIISKDDHIIPKTDDQAGEVNERKIMRRDNERQRRQHMTFLTASLRSLLPLEMIKGKRSVSDHMHEAVDYIAQLKNEIEELTVKRDELRDPYSSRAQDIDGESTRTCSENSFSKAVTVKPSFNGVEIVIRSDFPLSRVLGVLLEEGLNIVGCASTKINERLVHVIQSEVDDEGSTNSHLSELQQKLNVVLRSTSH